MERRERGTAWRDAIPADACRSTRVLMLIAGLDVRIVTDDGELIRELRIDPTKTYQGLGNAAGARMS